MMATNQKHTLIFVSLFVIFLTATCFPVWINAQEVSSEFPKAEVRMHLGTPTIFINGQPNAGFTYDTYNIIPEIYRDFGNIGVDLACFSTTCDFGFYFPDQPI